MNSIKRPVKQVILFAGFYFRFSISWKMEINAFGYCVKRPRESILNDYVIVLYFDIKTKKAFSLLLKYLHSKKRVIQCSNTLRFLNFSDITQISNYYLWKKVYGYFNKFSKWFLQIFNFQIQLYLSFYLICFYPKLLIWNLRFLLWKFKWQSSYCDLLQRTCIQFWNRNQKINVL